MKCLTTVLAAALLLGTAVPAQAAGERTAEKVVVTAGRIAEDFRQVPQAVTIVTNEEIEKNQYNDVGDLLRNYGFNVESYGSSHSDSVISIRGMKAQKSNPMAVDVVLLIDGRPSGGSNLSMIPMAGIERVEILRGPASVQYGSSAAGGVVNVITKRGGKDLKFSAEVGMGSFDAYRAKGGVSGSGSGLDFAAAANYSIQHDDYTTGQGKRYPDTSNDGRTDYMFNLGYTFADVHRIGLLVMGSDHNDMDMSQEFGWYSGDPNPAPPYHSDGFGFINRTNNSIDVNYEGGYAPAGLDWKLRYYTIEDDYKITYGEVGKAYASWNTDFAQEYETQGVQGQLNWKWNILSLTAGIDWSDSDFVSGSNPKYDQENVAGFLLAKIALLDETLFLTGGVRYDLYEYSVEGKSEDLDNVSLSAGVAWNPLDWLTLRANIGESFKVPSGIQVVGYKSGTTTYYGNPDLEPEESVGWDLGFEVNHKGFNAGLTYFSIDYDNYIDYVRLGSSRERQYVNLDEKTRLRGLEGQLSYDLGRAFDWNFMLQPYLYFTKMIEYDNEGEKMLRIRDLVASFGINYNDPNLGLTADLRFTYLGEQKEDSSHPTDFTTTYGEIGGDTLVDLFLAKTLYDWEDRGKLSIKGEIRNIFDEDSSYHMGYPMPGRSFYVGLKYEY